MQAVSMPRMRPLMKIVTSLGLALAMTLSFAAMGSAGDRRDGGNRHGRGHGHHGGNWPSYGGDGLPSYIPGIGTYAGGISAYRDRGNGTYFRIERRGGYYAVEPKPAPAPAPSAKIIRVKPGTNAEGCAWEAGVCVIGK